MEPDFWKNVFYRSKMPEICRKTRFFGIFSKFHHQFFWFSAQRCILVMFKMWRSSIFKIFSDRKCRKYAGNRHLYGFSWDYSLQLFVFSHKNVSNGDSRCLAILIFNRTNSCIRKSSEITAENRRKNGFSGFIRFVLNFFSWFLSRSFVRSFFFQNLFCFRFKLFPYFV